MRSIARKIFRSFGLAVTPLVMAACSAPQLASNSPPTASQKLLVNRASGVAVGSPRQVYLRIAKQASKCWFGPFGSAHRQFMTSADLPPPSSPGIVSMKVHRRTADRTKPWGTVVLRLEMQGKSTTTLKFANVGLDARTYSQMTNGLTRWANGDHNSCPALAGP